MRQAGPVGGHAVDAGHGANRDDLLISSFITHHPDARDGKQDRERLPDSGVHFGAAQLFIEDSIRSTYQPQPIGGDFANDPHRQPGTGKRMALEKLFGNVDRDR